MEVIDTRAHRSAASSRPARCRRSETAPPPAPPPLAAAAPPAGVTLLCRALTLRSRGLADVHLCKMYSGGLKNDWVVGESEAFQKDWSEADMLASAKAGGIDIKSYVFLECFNRSPADEAKWVQSMVDDPESKCVGFSAQIYAQHGAGAVTEFLDAVRDESGALPTGLKGARMVFPASDNNAPDACLEPKFLEGLEALQAAGLLWEFCCNPTMAPNLAECCAKFPGMTFVIDHCVRSAPPPNPPSLPPPPSRAAVSRRTTATTAARWRSGARRWTRSARCPTSTARWARSRSGVSTTPASPPAWTVLSPPSVRTRPPASQPTDRKHRALRHTPNVRRCRLRESSLRVELVRLGGLRRPLLPRGGVPQGGVRAGGSDGGADGGGLPGQRAQVLQPLSGYA